MRLTWLVPVAIAVAAVAPFVVLVFYLVLRRTETLTAACQRMEPPRDCADLLAEREDAAFAAAAEEIRSRESLEAMPQDSNDCANLQGEIDWSEPNPPYLPPTIDPILFFARIGITKHPKLTYRQHRVFVARAALETVEAHLRSNTSVELGGLLVGEPYYASSIDAYLVIVNDAYSADDGKETPVSFDYTADTWQKMTPKLQEMPAEYLVVGSYHSHPGIGVFLSSTDIDTQVCVFSQPWQIALVIDPIKNETGFFISPEGVLVPYDLF
jgi:proteasome lid subunit RPN8/RPN11